MSFMNFGGIRGEFKSYKQFHVDLALSLDKCSDCKNGLRESLDRENLCERHRASLDLLLWSFGFGHDMENLYPAVLGKICVSCLMPFRTSRITQNQCLACISPDFNRKLEVDHDYDF